MAEKYQNEYQFKFDHLESDKQEVIKDNLLLFIRLSKRGLIIEDLSKVDFKFVKWLSKHHDRFLWLLDNGLAAEQILNFNADQKEHIFAKFSSITRFAKRISLPKLFDLEECLPNETRVIKLFKFSISKN